MRTNIIMGLVWWTEERYMPKIQTYVHIKIGIEKIK